MTTAGSTLAPFKTKTFRRLWTVTLFSNLGDVVQGIGAAWLMTQITDSHSMVGLVQAAITLPVVIFSLMAGALADNFNRRRIMMTAQLMMMTVSALLASLTWFGALTPWLLLTFTFLIGCCGALYNPPWQTTVSDIVPRADIPAAVTLNSVGFNLMRSVGPAIGGTIVALWGGVAAFTVNVFSYLPLISALYFWQPQYEQPLLPRERLVGAMSDGLRYVMMSPHLMAVMARAFVFGIGAVSIMALLPLVARDMLQGDAFSYGSMLGCFGLGAIVAGLANSRIRAHLSSEVILVIAFVGFGLSCLLLGLSRSLILSHIVLMPAGLCWVFAWSLCNTTVQLSAPRWVVARTLALYQTASYAGMALGSWAWGAIADNYGTPSALVICGIFLLTGAFLGLYWPIRELGPINLDPSDRFREPELHLDLKPRSGPIMVMVDYVIEEENLAAFLDAMHQRRRIRLRDGARHWVLLRDLENPQQWTESYHMPTWVEYLRHNHRTTQADIEIIALLQSLNCNASPPRVHRMIERQTVPHLHEVDIKHPPHI